MLRCGTTEWYRASRCRSKCPFADLHNLSGLSLSPGLHVFYTLPCPNQIKRQEHLNTHTHNDTNVHKSIVNH